MNEYVPIPKAKRIFDISFACVLFVTGIPFLIFLFIWMAIEKIFSAKARTPIFYCEKRVSGGKKFQFCKFRIFRKGVIEAEQKRREVVHTKPLEKNKNNLSYYGRFLKQVYMDEFPQLWNVLKGDMTLVGPRPTNVENSSNIKKRGDYTRERIRCGITGPFQAHKGKGLNQRKVDEEYIDFIENNSGFAVVREDINILFKTVETVIRAEGI
jgi:lipopolysaccharide/colanic/teichoic acid biosynthesis glycosyltransferase